VTDFLDTEALRRHLETNDEPFRVRRGAGAAWKDRTVHAEAWSLDPELYALSALDGVQPGQAQRVLFQILHASHRGLGAGTRATLDRVVRVLLAAAAPRRALDVFLALRQARANHKHASRAIVGYLLEGDAAAPLVAAHRRPVADCLEHALGRDTARGIAKKLEAGPGASPPMPKPLRDAKDPERARAVFAYAFGRGPRPRSGRRDLDAGLPAPGPERAPRTITAESRGEISAALVSMYRGGRTADLARAVERGVERVARGLPRHAGRLGIVLDASASTAGYGEREYCIVAQSVALAKVLERCCESAVVRVVGGQGDPPRPGGLTDLAGAVLDVLEARPDAVAVITDGYENVYPGDLQAVLESLRGAGIATPVVVCHSKFTDKDDLEFRRPAGGAREVEFWHERDFRRVALAAMFAAGSREARDWLRQERLDRLAELEKGAGS
jgi:hypothetical protein